MHHVDDVVKARLKQIRMSSFISAVICPQNICLVSASKAEQTAADTYGLTILSKRNKQLYLSSFFLGNQMLFIPLLLFTEYKYFCRSRKS